MYPRFLVLPQERLPRRVRGSFSFAAEWLGRAAPKSHEPAQASSSSKSVSPSLRAKEPLARSLISQSDLQRFSLEDGCFEPALRTFRAACLNFT
jgi:hypothetical protein